MRDALVDQLRHIRGFQISDLSRALHRAQANLLVATGAMNAIEFLGGLDTGNLGEKGKARIRFEAGVRLLGADYTDFGVDALWAARCGLVHQYVYQDARFTDLHVSAAVRKPFFAVSGTVLTLYVGQVLDDLSTGWDLVLGRIQECPQAREQARTALSRLPNLE